MITTNYPLLYKKSSAGAIQHWKIEVGDAMIGDGAVITTTWGQAGGAYQTTSEGITVGKNVGKKNATTPRQQAEAEALAQWEKKLKKGYVQSLDAAKAGEVDECITGGMSPMLAHRFDEQGHKLKYPCHAQPKLDGHRCIAIVGEDEKVTLWSRTRKPITSMGHIVAAIEALKCKAGTTFDGELYNHSYKDKFERLTSYIRRPGATAKTDKDPGSTVVEYHIYDLPEDGLFETRHGDLAYIAKDFAATGPLKFVDTREVDDEDALMVLFEEFLKAGYEGAMARNSQGLYCNKRSYDLLKIKEFIDSEFEVVGVEEGRGKLAGHAIFVCKNADGAEFRAKLIGETAALKQYFEDPSLAVGRQLTVKYQGLTNSGIPRFPVAMRFKESV